MSFHYHCNVQCFHCPRRIPCSKPEICYRSTTNEENYLLDPLDLNSYRPISNLSFVSKLLERTIDYYKHAGDVLYSPVSLSQTPFCGNSPCKKIHNDTITSIDHGYVGALVLLDLSAAFDTVDHQLFLSVLLNRFQSLNQHLPGSDPIPPTGARPFTSTVIYRVGQIKRGHCAFLLVTNECIYQNLRFLAHINYIKRQIRRC